MKRRLTFPLLAFLFVSGLFAQEVLNNESVIKLVRAGLSEETIVNIVKTQPGRYDVSPEDYINLKNAKVPEKVISAMVEKGPAGPEIPSKEMTPTSPTVSSPPASPMVTPPPSMPTGTSSSPVPTDVGVYWKKNGNWIQLMPEVVNWQTGGVVKSAATLGVVKGDVNGRVYGAHSKTNVATPIEFLFRLAEGTEITEYQLIRCREHSGHREFRTVTGGVFHVSGGARRDLVDFDFSKIGERTFTVKLTNLGAGEYGFLPPGSAMQSHAAAQLGKMYTFRALE